MGRDFHYRPGSFYRICDRTGFATRAERTYQEWQGLIVDRRVYEARHPQDYVKGVDDNQTVPYARPRTPNPAVGTTLTAQFQVFRDPNNRASMEVQNHQFEVYHAASVVTPSSYPKSF